MNTLTIARKPKDKNGRKLHFITICSFCGEQKFVYKILDFVSLICEPCFRKGRHLKKASGLSNTGRTSPVRESA